MKVPCCRIFSVGEISSWARQFLEKLQQENIIEITFNPSVESFCKESVPHIPITFVENSADSKQIITKIREKNFPCYLVWYGRGFSKEDLLFAIEKRVYRVFENARPESEKLRKEIKDLARSADIQQDCNQILHALKTILVQSDGEDGGKLALSELKTAFNKLERCAHNNEFVSKFDESVEAGQGKIPFYQSQDFGDAISTVHDLERTGALIVGGSLPDQEGKIEFLQGKIVSAVTGRVRGLKAIYRMFLWDEPKFVFTRKDPEDFLLDEDIKLSMKYIRMEGDNLKKRFDSIRRELPPSDIRLEIEPSSLHVGLRLGRNDFSALASVVEFGKVSQVLDYNSLPDVNIYESLILLKRNNTIRVAA